MLIEQNGLIHYMDYSRDTTVYQTNSFADLPNCLQTTLGQGLLESAAAGFNRPITPDFSADVDSHIRDGNLMIIFQDGVVRGFAVNKVIREAQAVYLAGVVKHPRAPRGVIEAVAERFLYDVSLPFVITRTQNDRVVEMMDHLCDNLSPVDKPVSQKELEILDKAGLLSDNVDPKTLIARGHYGGPMMVGTRRRVENQRIRPLTDQLNYEAGDAVLLIGERRKRLYDL